MTAQLPSRWATGDEALGVLLAGLRAWKPLDAGALLDDATVALDDVVPGEEETEEIAQRLRGYLMQLVHIATASGVNEGSGYAGTLVLRARSLRSEELPGDYRRGVEHLRKMGWVTSELVDQLVAMRSIKEAA